MRSHKKTLLDRYHQTQPIVTSFTTHLILKRDRCWYLQNDYDMKIYREIHSDNFNIYKNRPKIIINTHLGVFWQENKILVLNSLLARRLSYTYHRNKSGPIKRRFLSVHVNNTPSAYISEILTLYDISQTFNTLGITEIYFVSHLLNTSKYEIVVYYNGW